MFDYEKIRKLVHEYYVRNGVVIKFDGNYDLTDQETILQAKIAVFLMNEARQDFRDEVDEKEVRDNNFDGYLNKLVKKYAINDDKNNYPQNIAIWNVVNSDGHFEVDDYSGDLSFLKTEFGEAIIRHVARKRGFDMDDIVIETIPNEKETGGNKIVIDFKKVPIIKERKQKYVAPPRKEKSKVEEPQEPIKKQTTIPTGPTETIMPKKPVELTYAELKLNEKVKEAKKAGDSRRLAHWNFMLDELYRGSLDTNDLDSILKDPEDEVVTETEVKAPETEQPKSTAETDIILDEDAKMIEYIEGELVLARASNDEEMIKKWERELYLYSTEGKRELDYLKQQIRLAEEADDKYALDKWTAELAYLRTGKYPDAEPNMGTANKM